MTAALLAWLALLSPGAARAQVYVVPRRPGQSVVREIPHQWEHIDLLVDAPIQGAPAGGVRLLFYDSERATAEVAAARIEEAYRELAAEFGFTPPVRFPFVLYSSYQEFLRTNLFPIQEGVLGVTSPTGLEVTLPYFGDHARFAEVARHELAHQFTIQKIREASRGAHTWGDPMAAMPLWFVEGLAEYHAHGRRLDDETRATLTDLVVNPDPMRGYALPAFFDDTPWSVLGTYALGQARCAFLEATYGAGTTQRVLERSPELVGSIGHAGASFEHLLQRITGDDPVVMAARFDTWLKRQLLPGWLEGGLDPGLTRPFVRLDGLADSLDAAPDGRVLLYRSMERSTGRFRLVLVDPRDPGHSRRVARDQEPGAESLHPVDPRSYDLGAQALVYVAERRGRDVIHWRAWAAEEKKARRAERDRAQAQGEPPPPRVPIHLGRHRRYELRSADLVAAFSPALSPDQSQVAFVGLGLDGQRDLWCLDLGTGALRRLTQDPYAEREVAWGPQGIVVTSDATPEGAADLFLLDPAGGLPLRLATGQAQVEDPAVLPDGTVLFTAVGGEHRDVWAFTEGGPQRRTAATTSLEDPAPGPEGDWWALIKDSGRWWPARLPASARLPEPPLEAASPPSEPASPPPEPVPDSPPPAPALPWPLPRADLSQAVRYRSLEKGSWGLENIFALVGAGGGSIYGQAFVSATDLMRDHAVVFSAAVYGSLSLADGSLLYIDQSRRVTWGVGAFSALRFRIDDSYADEGVRFQAGQRYHGALLTARYPLDRFLHVQVEQTVGAADSFLYTDTADALGDPEANAAGRDLLTGWEAGNDRARLQEESTLRFGADTIRYHPATGPIAGWSALVEGSLGSQPVQGEWYESLRLDAEGYLPLERSSGANIAVRGAAGTAGGGAFARSWFLYGPTTLRGVRLSNTDFLLGRHFGFATTELQVPVDWLVRVAFLSSVEGIVGLDLGGASDDPATLWDKRVLDVALGGNLSVGPLVFRLHVARALDIGAPLPEPDRPWVTNFSLGWIGD